METLEELIVNHPFWAGLNPHYIDLLKNCATFQRFDVGQSILQEGGNAERFYLIQKGRVTLHAFVPGRGTITVQTVGAGDALGWSWLFPPHVWHFTARAVEPTEAIFFYGTILRDYCERDPSLGYELFKRMTPVMIKRLQSARRKMLSVYARKESLERVVVEPWAERR